MTTKPTDDLLALMAIAIGTAANAAITMALFTPPPRLADVNKLSPAPIEESPVFWAIIEEPIIMEPILMVGPEDEGTGWNPWQEEDARGEGPGR